MNGDIEEGLIARGSGKWSLAGVPQRGWACNGIDDLGAPNATCEMCEVQSIRYVHYMTHQEYPDELAVGCVCAGHMEQDYDAARNRERVLRNASRRRRNWLLRKWRISRNGNPYINTDGFNITVFQKGRVWSARIVEKESDAPYFAKRQYDTEDEAKLAAFAAMLFFEAAEELVSSEARLVFGTDPHIERARAHLASGDHHRLLYACLELRYALERIAYQKLQLRLEKVTIDEIAAWQPRRALERLMELVDAHLARGSTLRVASDSEPGTPAKDNFVTVGQTTGVSPREIGRHWQKLGSYLHIRMPRKKGQHPQEFDEPKLRTFLEDVIEYVELIASTKFDAYFSYTATFSCEKCGHSIVRNSELLDEETIVECQNEQCNASYITHFDNDAFRFEPYFITLDCKNCDQRAQFDANTFLKLKTNETTTFACNGCDTRYLVRWTLEYGPESDALGQEK